MKKIIRVFGIILLIAVLTTNISYANTITKEQLNASIEKLFSKAIKIETKSETEYGTSTGTMEISGENVKIVGNQIILTYEESDTEFIINYVIEDNVCKFESSIDLPIDENSTEEDAWNAVWVLMYQNLSLNICYLAVADALGIDLSLAYTYYSQNIGESTDVENDIFNVKTISAEESGETDTTSAILEVNLLEMSKLDASKIDQSSYSTVTLVEPNEEDQIEDEKELPVDEEEKEPQVKEDSEEEKKTPVNEDVKIDDTLANNDIPKAGIENVINIIGIILIVVCVLYLKNKKYRDIK